MAGGVFLEAVLKAVSAQGEYQHVFPITPGSALPMPTRAIRCAMPGTLVIDTVGGETGVTVNFLAGETRPLCAIAVDSGTATGIEGMA